MSGPKRVDRTEFMFEGQRRTWLLMTAVDDAGSSDAECDEVFKIRRGTLVEDTVRG